MGELSNPFDDNHPASQHGVHFLCSVPGVHKVWTEFPHLRQLEARFVQRHVPVEVRKDCLEQMIETTEQKEESSEVNTGM